ncbi:reverse transcriptase domain-containing protein [Aeromonas enteropelogenes]|uniref:reverse transcriptase domain-containing protein n=1 Tax=Aeromonas enteropelogenes TaxID=29489 RepID=UPI003B9E3492
MTLPNGILLSIEDVKNQLKPTKPTCITGCNSTDALALFLGFENYNELQSLIYPSINNLYRNFYIDKKSGDKRLISAPKKRLKSIQRTISHSLNNIYSPRKSAHGFITGKSILTNASMHVDKKFVLNVDLLGFFDSLHFGRVRNLFQSYPLNLTTPVATVLAHICCLNGKLPQGAPTSPIISNMIAYKLDKDLHQLAATNRSTYTRYVDDITFSFTQSRRRLPRDIVTVLKENNLKLGEKLISIIEKNGFKLNNEKSRCFSQSLRQVVTGLVVNERVNVSRGFIRQTRSMIYAWKKFGLINAALEYLSRYHDKSLLEKHHLFIRDNKDKGVFFSKIFFGRINFIGMVRGKNDRLFRKILYSYTECIGKPNKSLINTPLDKIGESIFIIENTLDDAQGTGFLLDGIGLVTNQHVVDGIDKDNSVLLEIYRHFEQDKKRKSNFDKSCRAKDLAILKPTTDFNGIKRLKVGDDSILKIGSKITVMGFPQYSPGETPYINSGKIVQSKILFGNNVWLLDIPVIHGNSGGPVLNEKLEVIGIASIGSAKHDHSTKLHGFIPISTLINYVNE